MTVVFVALPLVVNYVVFFHDDDRTPPPPAPAVEERPAATPRPDVPAAPAPPAMEEEAEDEGPKVLAGELRSGDRMHEVLCRLGLDTTEARRAIGAMERVFDFRLANVGDRYEVTVDPAGRIDLFAFVRSPLEIYEVTRDGDTYTAARREIETTIQVAELGCIVRGGYHQSLLRCASDADLATQIRDLLAWTVDWASETREGDEVRVLVERVLADGEFLRFGRVLAADYRGKLVSSKLFYFVPDDADDADGGGYYTADGSTVERRFLRSPFDLSDAKTTAEAPLRPVLHRYRRHIGLDYAVPKGTGVVAVADGVVSSAGPKGSSGTLVTIRHPGRAVTYYAHLSRIARGIRRGARVEQGQLIAWSGDSGKTSEPRLHYALKLGRRFENPLETEPEPKGTVARDARAAFDERVTELSKRLDAITVSDPGPHGA